MVHARDNQRAYRISGTDGKFFPDLDGGFHCAWEVSCSFSVAESDDEQIDRFLARSLQDHDEEPQGSWRICEKDSDAIVSRHPGDRTWNDLLG